MFDAIRTAFTNLFNRPQPKRAFVATAATKITGSSEIMAIAFRQDTGTLRVFSRDWTVDYHGASWEHYNYLCDPHCDPDEALRDIQSQLIFCTEVSSEDARGLVQPFGY